jgi:hypothetical protein
MTDEMVAYQSPTGMETALGEFSGATSVGSGDRIRTCDLWVMVSARRQGRLHAQTWRRNLRVLVE